MRCTISFFTLSVMLPLIAGSSEHIFNRLNSDNREEIEMIADIIIRNIKYNGWHNILFMGLRSDILYNSLIFKKSHSTFTITDIYVKDVRINDVVPFYSNTIIIDLENLKDFEAALRKMTTSFYWHPLANIILYYHGPYEKQTIAKIFFIIWYFRGINTIIIQRDVLSESIFISYYNPYISENFQLQYLYGCWTAKRLGSPIKNFEKNFVCEENCNNVSLSSSLRANHLGTCIGFNTYKVSYGDYNSLRQLVLFDDKTKNLHGFTFRGILVEILPFLKVNEYSNGNYTIDARDGMIWNGFANYINFTIDLSAAKDMIKKPFNYEVNIQQLFAFTQRKVDLLMFPIYQFDVVVAEVDYTFPYAASGVCFLSHRAGFETVIFDAKLLQNSKKVIVEYLLCFASTWFVFFLFNTEQLRRLNCDQAGKDLMNACKTVLSISVDKVPKRITFRIFLATATWSFFVINFSTQAAIISLFSAYKRGENIDTFEDVYEKIRDNKSIIEGIPSPDIVLPTADERINKITSKLIPKQDIFDCIRDMKSDKRVMCLSDCTVGHYLERSLLDEKGQRFLHLAKKDRIHSMYLNMIFHRHSPLTEHYNKCMLTLFEAGLIRKWTEYKYNDMKEEIPVKVLGMDDLAGIFEVFCLATGISSIIFILEVLICFNWIHKFRRFFLKNDN